MWEWLECRLVRAGGAKSSRFLRVLLWCLSNYVKPLINHIWLEVTQTSPVSLYAIAPISCVLTHDEPETQGKKESVLEKQRGRCRCYTHNLTLRPLLHSLMSLILLEPVSGCCVRQKRDAGRGIKSACFSNISCSHANLLCNQQISISPSSQSVNKIAAFNLSLAAGI